MFYVMAEMWGSVVASLLFWSFANEVTTVDEAKKYCKALFIVLIENDVFSGCVCVCVIYLYTDTHGFVSLNVL